MVKAVVIVAIGGGLGAMARYGLALWLNPDKLSVMWGTLVANLLGSFLMGLFLGWTETQPVPNWLKLLFMIGFCGALTTFSSFAAETLILAIRERMGTAFLAVVLHTFGSLGSIGVGYALFRYWLAP